MNDPRLVYMTTSSVQEAKEICRKLVAKKLIACANIINNVTSIYEWNASITEEVECMMIAKTTQAKVDTLVSEFTKLHSYECPCILILPIESGNQQFIQWLKETVH